MQGADFAIFAFGGNADEAFKSVLECMKVSADGHQMGRITLVGGCKFEVGGGSYSGNIDIRASSRTGPGYHDHDYEYGRFGTDYPNGFIQFTTKRNLREIISLIDEKRLLVSPMTTHHFRLENIAEAVQELIDHPGRAMGVVLNMR